jgi:hypothetical protein
MKIEDQVCSLELSKKLKELGIKQESLFRWISNNINNEYYELVSRNFEEYYSENLDYVVGYGCGCCGEGYLINKVYSAFSSAELLEILPNTLTIDENDPMSHGRINIIKATLAPDKIFKSYFIINYLCTSTDNEYFYTLFKNIYDTNLANACARLLVYLIENKFIEVKNDNN